MNLVRWMKWSNGLLLISAVIQAITGAMLFLGIIPVTSVKLADLHKFNGPLLVMLIAFHVAINWSWFKTHYFRRKPINRVMVKK